MCRNTSSRFGDTGFAPRSGFPSSQEETYSGYIFGDYYLLHSYFYPHMEYSVKYSSDMEEILAQAKENMTFYQESGNTAGAAENAYILHHYAGWSR